MKATSVFKFLPLLVQIFICGLVTAQETKRERFQMIAKWTPTTLLTPQTPTWQFGVELLFPNFSKHGLSVEFDYGFRSGIFNYIYPETLNYTEIDPKNIFDKHYSKYHFELRKVLFSKRQKYFFYTAVEGFYIPYTFIERYYYYNGNYLTDLADANKDIRGGTLKFGFFVKVGSRLSFEYFGGLGVREVNLTFTNTVHRPWIDGLDSSSKEIDPNDGERTKPHLAVGFKVGYRVF